MLIAGAALGGCTHPRANEVGADLSGSLAPSNNLVIVIDQDLGPAYRLMSSRLFLDGKPIFEGRGEAALGPYRGYAPPGSHALSVVAQYQPNDYKLFTYARGYHIQVSGSSQITTGAVGPTEIRAVITDQGGLAARIDQQAVVRFVVSQPEAIARR